MARWRYRHALWGSLIVNAIMVAAGLSGVPILIGISNKLAWPAGMLIRSVVKSSGHTVKSFLLAATASIAITVLLYAVIFWLAAFLWASCRDRNHLHVQRPGE
ncbi:hypothetical protein HDF16_002985 [Granulicella aggregans]|uniref:Uncharacterized protein n=1 Tax=Granulicella aggregans TaxID=474949 RepID=A0A7W7ZF97_9BACT|nr:hypothetical protein [Granulicella aggregans]